MISKLPPLPKMPKLSAEQERKLHEVWLRIDAFLSLKSDNTKKTYEGIILQWCDFLEARMETNEGAYRLISVSDLHAVAYINWLTKQKGHLPRLVTNRDSQAKKDGLQSTLSNSTIAKKVAALRRMYRMLVASNVGIENNPFDPDKVQTPAAKSGQKRPTEMIDFEKVKEIVDLPTTETPKGLRDRAILAVLFGAGLRKSEVISLRVGDVRSTADGICFLRLRATKNKKDADQPLPKWSAQELEIHLDERRKQGAANGDYLFTGYIGRGGAKISQNPISASGLHKLFKSYCALAGASHYATLHSARATAITKLLTDGFDHKYVQKFSRHSSPQMVDVYDKRRLDIEDNPGLKLDY